MNEKEVAEIRRRFRPAKSNITHIRGCYVNEKQEIISEFSQSLALMSESETEKILAILKKTLSGTINKNLMDIEFSIGQVVKSEEHSLLMALRDSKLKDDEAIHAFFEKAIQAISLEGNYLILLAHDAYDVPFRSSDGQQQNDASSEVFPYMLCSICPVKQTKPALSYYVQESEFHSIAADRVVSSPELGFMFPAFDDRCANIYKALFYSRNISETYEEFIGAVFNCEAPVPAAAQKENFHSLLGASLEEDSSYEVVQAIHNQLKEMIEEHKENKEEQPLVVSKNTVKRILQNNGVSNSHIESFDMGYDSQFGEETSISPRNIVDMKQIELSTSDVTIRVNSMRSDLIDTRVIDGSRYILIRVEDEAQVNGVPININ